MNKPVTLITYSILFLFSNILSAQNRVKAAEDEDSKRDTKTFSIQSLDGKDQVVHIMPDYPKHVLRISCLKDTISLLDYWDVPPETVMLNKSFIKLEYAVRGGSDLGLGNMIILCVNNNKLYEAMHVLRYIDSQLSYVEDEKNFNEHSNYVIKVTLSGNTKNNYKLNISVHDEVKSTSNPESIYNYQNQSVLNFDVNKNVFYSIKDDLYGSYKVYLPGRKKKAKQKIRGNFPVIILGKETYYFIKDSWYSIGRDNELSGYTSRNIK